MKHNPTLLAALSLAFFASTAGFAFGNWLANTRRIQENPIYDELSRIGIDVNIDGIGCANKDNYGTYSPTEKAVNLCLIPHNDNKYESVQSTFRHEGFHVLQSCYHNPVKVKNEDTGVLQGSPSDANGVFFTKDEFKRYFNASNSKEFLGQDFYEGIIGDYPKEQEPAELEARVVELSLSDNVVANYLNTYCKSL